MTPAQFLSRLQKQGPEPATLFLGPDSFYRRRCRTALLEAVLEPDEREQGLRVFDLKETALAEVVDDARSPSLFAARRLLIATNADEALPAPRGEDAGAGPAGLEAYLGDPSPDVVLLFECSRFEFEGEDKKRLERVRKFFDAIPTAVELRRPPPGEALAEARQLARKAGLQFAPEALEDLVESLSGDLERISTEIGKLGLFKGNEKVGKSDIASLVPAARSATVFELVNALARRDRHASLALLDTLVREGEYLPLVLTFLATQFRLALLAREAGLRSVGQVQGHFSRLGIPMWPSRAEQVWHTAGRFTADQLAGAVQKVFETDRDLRSARPDDRIVMEKLVLGLTG